MPDRRALPQMDSIFATIHGDTTLDPRGRLELRRSTACPLRYETQRVVKAALAARQRFDARRARNHGAIVAQLIREQCRRLTEQRLELTNHVRLVVKAALGRERRPAFGPAMKLRDARAQPDDPRVLFRAQSGRRVEFVEKPALRVAESIAELRDLQKSVLLLDRPCDQHC